MCTALQFDNRLKKQKHASYCKINIHNLLCLELKLHCIDFLIIKKSIPYLLLYILYKFKQLLYLIYFSERVAD